MMNRLIVLVALLSSFAAHAAPRVLSSDADLQAVDFSKDRVVFIGETDHFDSKLLPVEMKILEGIDASNKSARKCLLLEADPQFDEAFQVLSKSTAPDSLAKANAILDTHDLMTSTVHWIGDTYPLVQFEFAAKHGWTVRAGDMLRGKEYWDMVQNGNPSDEWSDYHVIYLRNRFMAKRVAQLLKSDCDLVVGLYGATHLSAIKPLPTFKVQIIPVPTLLEKAAIRSTTVFAVNPKSVLSSMWTNAPGQPRVREPDAIANVTAP